MSSIPGPSIADRLDYLQRLFTQPYSGAPERSVRPERRMNLRVEGIGRTQDSQRAIGREVDPHPLAEELVTGLSGLGFPIVSVLTGTGNSVEVTVGSWAASDSIGEQLQDDLTRQALITSALLRAQTPEIDLRPHSVEHLEGGDICAGLVIGTPSFKPPTVVDPAVQIDRLIRGMGDVPGEPWQTVVLAEPVYDESVARIRNGLIAEMRSTETDIARARVSGALAASLEEHYLQLQMFELSTLSHAMAGGGWRTAVYLVGSPAAYYRLSSLWRGLFQGDQSQAVPVRVLDDPGAADLARRWAMPDVAGADGGGFYRRPFEHQTLLTSTQLATYVQLPTIETPGFSVRLAASFDVVPGTDAVEDVLELGKIVDHGKVVDRRYKVPFDALTRHALVAGITGGGKTNTMFHLLELTHRRGTPFLVIEPAKTEYRELLSDGVIGDALRVFTLGDEQTAPFRMNPFEPEPGTPIGTHIDLLRSVFGVSLGMWTPLPQVVEQAIHGIYRDRGWDVTRDLNTRLDAGAERHRAFPTITDLIAEVERIVPELGYGEEVEGNVLGALRTRLNSLRTGGRGRMLDTQWSYPIAELAAFPTIMELEGVGDDDDKAFLIGMLMIRLAEHRRGVGPRPGLEHLLVIEEAHRLLANASQVGAETADPRGKAVETFANLLSEVRAYGQGIVIVDQVPTKLAPDVVKNTALKVIHRIVALEDRTVLAGAMAMNESQANSLVTLPIGRAAVLSGYDDTPILVQVPLAKGGAAVTGEMLRARRDERLSGCRVCQGSPSVCGWGSRFVEEPDAAHAFRRLVLSSFDDATAPARLIGDVRDAIRAAQAPDEPEDELLAAVLAHAADRDATWRGAAEGWTYSETDAFRQALTTLLVDTSADRKPESWRGFSALISTLCLRDIDPLPGCGRICNGDGGAVCLYRSTVAGGAVTDDHSDVIDEAFELDSDEPGPSVLDRTHAACLDVAFELVEFPGPDTPAALTTSLDDRAERVARCVGQHHLAADHRTPWSQRRHRIELLIEEPEP